jgi:hypothetical protein
MKRLNPTTGLPFKRGDLREDGFVFCCYTTRIKSNASFVESWYSPTAWAQHANLKLNWQRKNQKQHNKKSLVWRKNNRDYCNYATATYKANKKFRTPKWLTVEQQKQIKLWYHRAKLASIFTGNIYEVDHIIPLKGDKVSGLHVPWNLQILTKTENVKKSNLF